MSGIASAAPTTPGSVATLQSCSREVSRAIDTRSSESANTRAGTRMPARPAAGISQTNSSTCWISDVENDACSEAIGLLAELETMVGDSLHELGRSTRPSADDGPQGPVREGQ